MTKRELTLMTAAGCAGFTLHAVLHARRLSDAAVLLIAGIVMGSFSTWLVWRSE